MTNVTSKASGATTKNIGVGNFSSTAIITNSIVEGSTFGIDTSGTTRVFRSSIIGGANIQSGTLSCTSSDNGVDTDLQANCALPPPP